VVAGVVLDFEEELHPATRAIEPIAAMVVIANFLVEIDNVIPLVIAAR
jgi:hypothetical protein